MTADKKPTTAELLKAQGCEIKNPQWWIAPNEGTPMAASTAKETPSDELAEAVRHLKARLQWDRYDVYEAKDAELPARDFIWHLELKYGEIR